MKITKDALLLQSGPWGAIHAFTLLCNGPIGFVYEVRIALFLFNIKPAWTPKIANHLPRWIINYTVYQMRTDNGSFISNIG